MKKVLLIGIIAIILMSCVVIAENNSPENPKTGDWHDFGTGPKIYYEGKGWRDPLEIPPAEMEEIRKIWAAQKKELKENIVWWAREYKSFTDVLNALKENLKGYPGFSIFYDTTKVKGLTELLDNDFVNTVLGGVDKWGEAALCRKIPSQVTGAHNTAVSPYLGGAAASIAAERVAMENATNPAQNVYIYKIEYYVDPGSDERIGCRKLQFTIRFKHPRRGDISLYINSVTKQDWVFTLGKGDAPLTPSAVMDSTIPMQLAQSKNDYVGKKFCIKFHKVDPDYCLVGLNDGDEICAHVIDGAHYTPDYKCGNIWCKIFTFGRGWKFEPSIPPAAEGGNIIPNSLDDPATGQAPRDPDTGHIIFNLD